MDTNAKKDKRRGIIGTILFYMILIPFLYFFGFKIMEPEGEEGVLISYGNTETGMGNAQPAPAKQVVKNTPPAEPVVVKKPTPATEAKPEPKVVEEQAKEDVVTQDFDEEAPEIDAAEKKRLEEELKKKQEEEAELKRLQEIEDQKKRDEEERLRKIEEEKERIRKEEEAERIRKEKAEEARKKKIQDQLEALDKERQTATDNNSNASNPFAFGKGDSESTGKGDENTAGNKGAEHGDPNSNATSGSGLGSSGNSYDLTGRRLSGKLPNPTYTVQEQGTVVIDIVVDKTGKVIAATIQPLGTTIQKKALWDAAKAAAMNAKFNTSSTAPEKQQGTITYQFLLN